MNIADITLNAQENPSILGIPFEKADLPFVQQWRDVIPSDFNKDSKYTAIQFEFEMSGIRRGEKAIRRLAKYCSVRDKTVLDVGSGNGGMCIAAALDGAREVHGLEFLDSRIALSRQWAKCRNVEIDIKQGVAELLPYPNESIDVVFMFSVIEHVNSHTETVREIARVLRPGGYAVIEGPNRLSPRFFLSDPHYQTFAVSALPRPIAKWWVCKVKKITANYDVGIFPVFSRFAGLLRAHGFEVMESEHFNYLIQRLENPSLIGSKLKPVAKALEFFKLNSLIATILKNTSPTFEIIVRKPVRETAPQNQNQVAEAA